jgi:hypothetical protein
VFCDWDGGVEFGGFGFSEALLHRCGAQLLEDRRHRGGLN